jgi:hypothetical protein
MRFPQIVVHEFDGWLSRQLRELAESRQWLLRESRQTGASRNLLRQRRPTVFVVQFDPTRESPDGPQLIAEMHSYDPDLAIIAVSDVKLHDNDRAAWTATLMDLGARGVLFPPLTRPVLEEVVGQFMTAVLKRTRPGPAEPAPVIDLAREGIVE